jgi:hypothetical protein
MKESDWKRKKEEKERKRNGKKDMRGMNQVRYERDESSERKIKCKEGCHVVEGRNFHSFFNHVQSDNEDVISAS